MVNPSKKDVEIYVRLQHDTDTRRIQSKYKPRLYVDKYSTCNKKSNRLKLLLSVQKCYLKFYLQWLHHWE